MSPDIIGAVVEYLQEALSGDLQVGGATSSGSVNPGVFADYARDTIDGVPYCVVHDGPETYVFSSSGGGNLDSTTDIGGGELVVSDGFCFVAIVAPTKKVARALGIKVVRLLTDTVVALYAQDGEIIHLRPIKNESPPMTDPGPGVPTTFKRVITVEYRQQWTSP